MTAKKALDDVFKHVFKHQVKGQAIRREEIEAYLDDPEEAYLVNQYRDGDTGVIGYVVGAVRALRRMNGDKTKFDTTETRAAVKVVLDERLDAEPSRQGEARCRPVMNDELQTLSADDMVAIFRESYRTKKIIAIDTETGVVKLADVERGKINQTDLREAMKRSRAGFTEQPQSMQNSPAEKWVPADLVKKLS